MHCACTGCIYKLSKNPKIVGYYLLFRYPTWWLSFVTPVLLFQHLITFTLDSSDKLKVVQYPDFTLRCTISGTSRTTWTPVQTTINVCPHQITRKQLDNFKDWSMTELRRWAGWRRRNVNDKTAVLPPNIGVIWPAALTLDVLYQQSQVEASILSSLIPHGLLPTLITT